jgi:hypothetical protein
MDALAAAGYKIYTLDSIAWDSECATVGSNPCAPRQACAIWPSATAQIQEALNAGLEVAVYNRNPQCWSKGLTGLGPYLADIRFYVLDIETDPGVAPTAAMVSGIEALGVQPVIYSYQSAWDEITGNSTAFSALPLWDSEVNTDVEDDGVPPVGYPALAEPIPPPYGAWTTAVAEQQTFNTVVDGVSIDDDSFSAPWLLSLRLP